MNDIAILFLLIILAGGVIGIFRLVNALERLAQETYIRRRIDEAVHALPPSRDKGDS